MISNKLFKKIINGKATRKQIDTLELTREQKNQIAEAGNCAGGGDSIYGIPIKYYDNQNVYRDDLIAIGNFIGPYASGIFNICKTPGGDYDFTGYFPDYISMISNIIIFCSSEALQPIKAFDIDLLNFKESMLVYLNYIQADINIDELNRLDEVFKNGLILIDSKTFFTTADTPM